LEFPSFSLSKNLKIDIYMIIEEKKEVMLFKKVRRDL
jgi:Holliday junction resolvase RusA-like endonuclease